MAMTALWRSAGAAPVPLTGELPITNEDVAALRAQLSTDEFFRTIDFLGSLRVFEDDTSTPSHPKLYLAPVFAADTSKEIIGGQEIATEQLGYLDQLDELLSSVQASHRALDRLEILRADYLALRDRLAARQAELSLEGSRRLLDYATSNNPYQRELDAIPSRVTAAMNQLSVTLQRQIASAILEVLDRLKVPLTAAERDLVSADPIKFVLGVAPRVRATLATSLLGLRHATFVSGMTPEQTHLLANYRRVRPDVVLSALPIWALRVVPVASAADSDSSAAGKFLAAPEMIRGVNASTGGVCGVLSSCTVIVEYTEMGARSALLSARGAAIMPAQFIGDVTVRPGALTTPVFCDISALRRFLALPFGLGLLGDRELLRVLASSDVCRAASGAVTKLASALLLTSTYRNLLFDTTQLSVARRQQLPDELAQLEGVTRGVMDRLGSVSTFLRAGDARSYLTRFTKSYYTRLTPRFPDELIDALLISSGPSPETARFDFDGIPIACWKTGPDKKPYLSACPDNAPEAPDLQSATGMLLETRECSRIFDLAGCVAKIQAALPPDGHGFLWTAH